MAPQFSFPQNLRALEEEDEQEPNRLYVQNPTDVASLRPSQIEELVKGVSFDLSDREIFCIEDQDVFDRVYSLILGFSTLTPSCKLNLVESLRSNLSVLLPNVDSLSRVESLLLDKISSHRNAFKIYTFFLFNVLSAEESLSSSNNNSKTTAGARKKQIINAWKPEEQRGRILTLIANSLDINLTLLFGSSDLDENYLSFVVKNSFSMFENSTVLKDSDSKDALCRIIGACATKYHYTVQSCVSIIHLIHKYDFVVTHMADAVSVAEKKYGDATLATSLIREIGRTDPKSYVKDVAGADNVGRFLVELADRLPKLISTYIGVLVPHFGGESYKIRNALVGVLGKLVTKAFQDVEGDVSSRSVRLRTKQAMLEILLERCRDVSAYTRSRVLQVWSELCEEHSVSIGMWNEVASVAAGRLEDKSAIVRKSALNLLITMMQHNPFGPELRVASFEATLEQYRKKLRELEPIISSESASEDLPSTDDPFNEEGEVNCSNVEGLTKIPQESLSDSCLQQVEEHVAEDGSVPDFGNLEQTKALVASLEAGLMFSTSISATMPILVQLMASSSASDVENTIFLLMRCKQFHIDGAEACLRKMLPLVFSQDKSTYEAVENAFITIYIRKNPVETAKNLLHLAIDSNIGDQAALEFIVGALVSKEDISTSMISALWDFFCFNISGTTAEQSRGALSVLCMAAKASPGILGSHIQDILDIGFGRWAKVEPLLARSACIAIQRFSVEDRKKLLLSNGTRVFSILESLITGFWLPDNIWYAAADTAISALYTIHPLPETFAADVIKKSLRTVFDLTGQDELPNNVNGVDILTTIQVAKLSRYLFITSHIALNQLVYIESCVRKIQKQKDTKQKQAADDQNNNTSKAGLQKDDNITAELGLAASEDAILDTLAERAEREIVSSGSKQNNLIGECAPFLSKLCRNFSLMQKHPELQASAMLALCRFMIIDAHYCESNLQLLFTVVENAPSEIVRSNCTVSLGDLAVRFPNLLEPWTENMYARLQDPSVCVRQNAVLVLSHLILNDMMKVKGYINEMAVRVVDDDEKIANLAKLFFHELSKKGMNPIYNLLPDMLGKLSNQNLERESFCTIMQFLIGSIKKDKQMDALVEKLCNRFSGVSDTRQWEYISYCLSQLTFTDKGMKKLIESFKSYEHALAEDSVMEHFRGIINKSKKFAKPEIKASIDEFEEKLDKFHMEKKEQELTARNAEFHRAKIVARCGQEESTVTDAAGEEETTVTDVTEKEETTVTDAAGEEETTVTDAATEEETIVADAAGEEETTVTDVAGEEESTVTTGAAKAGTDGEVIDPSTDFNPVVSEENCGNLSEDEVLSPKVGTKSKPTTAKVRTSRRKNTVVTEEHCGDLSENEALSPKVGTKGKLATAKVRTSRRNNTSKRR